MPVGFIRIKASKVEKKYGYSKRTDKVRIAEAGHPLNGITLEGGICHVKNKNVEGDFMRIYDPKTGKYKGREGIDIQFLIDNQPQYVKELASVG